MEDGAARATASSVAFPRSKLTTALLVQHRTVAQGCRGCGGRAAARGRVAEEARLNRVT